VNVPAIDAVGLRRADRRDRALDEMGFQGPGGTVPGLKAGRAAGVRAPRPADAPAPGTRRESPDAAILDAAGPRRADPAAGMPDATGRPATIRHRAHLADPRN
jgi:hypothetical protein